MVDDHEFTVLDADDFQSHLGQETDGSLLFGLVYYFHGPEVDESAAGFIESHLDAMVAKMLRLVLVATPGLVSLLDDLADD